MRKGAARNFRRLSEIIITPFFEQTVTALKTKINNFVNNGQIAKSPLQDVTTNIP